MITRDELFDSHKEEAFRLEMLPQYKVEGEWDDFLLYQKDGTIIQDEEFKEYMTAITQKINEGKRHIRARIIPSPLTDYFIFETKLGYIPQHEACIEHYFLEEEQFKKYSNGFNGDFWLFDQKHIIIMNYGVEGSFLSEEFIEDEKLLEKLLYIRNIMIEQGKPLTYVLKKYDL